MALDYRGTIGATGLAGASSPGLAALIEQIDAARPAWMKDALCREHPEVSWYPERGEPAAPAKAVCGVYGITHEEPAGHGIWGGLGPNDRRQLRAGRAA